MNDLAIKNLKGKPLRTAVLIILSALLALFVFGGAVLITSLKKGLSSLEDRLGADIMVVPYEAVTQKRLEDIILQGNTGYFYMNDKLAEKVSECSGIGQISPQFFLASTSSGCCSIPVQIIGFDPETDFVISPWIKRSGGDKIGKSDIVVGNDLNAFVGDKLTFYGVECNVAAKLEKTGTSYDTAVFANEDTVKELIRSSLDRNMNDFQNIDPERSVSCLLINTAEGYSPEEVMNDINIHVKKVKAIRSKDMISGISESLSGISSVTEIFMLAIWLLGSVILLLAFTMNINERRKEFAVIRVLGASKKMLAGLVIKEAMTICLSGSLIGICICMLILFPFNNYIENLLGLPFLIPSAGNIALYAAGSILVSVISGMTAAAFSARKISSIDTGIILRGDGL